MSKSNAVVKGDRVLTWANIIDFIIFIFLYREYKHLLKFKKKISKINIVGVESTLVGVY